MDKYPTHRCKECSLVRCQKENDTCEECLSRIPALESVSLSANTHENDINQWAWAKYWFGG